MDFAIRKLTASANVEECFVIYAGSFMWLNKVADFSFDASKRKDLDSPPCRKTQESAFLASAKTRYSGVQRRRESVFDVGIILDLSRLDRGVQSQQCANCQNWTEDPRSTGVHLRLN